MKQKELIQGHWYTSTDWSNECYIKFKHIDNDKVYFTEVIVDGVHKIKEDWYSFNRAFKHVPIEEIEQYLPKPLYEVVHCTTQEELEFASKIVGRNDLGGRNAPYCVHLDGDFDKVETCLNSPRHKVYTFYDWLVKFNHLTEWNELTRKSMNTYGLKVGDHLPVNIIREWSGLGENSITENSFNIDNQNWHKNNGHFTGDRKIESFKEVDGHIGFLVSGTANVYLKAEGFKEFMNGKDTFILPEKWCINREDKPEVIEWFNRNGTKDMDYGDILLGYYTHYPSWGSSNYTSSTIKDGYTEITLDQFKKCVLKENIFEMYKESIAGDILSFDDLALENSKVLNAAQELMSMSSNKNLIIPIIVKPKSNVNYNLDLKLPDLRINLVKNQPKKIKQVKLENFSITI